MKLLPLLLGVVLLVLMMETGETEGKSKSNSDGNQDDDEDGGKGMQGKGFKGFWSGFKNVIKATKDYAKEALYNKLGLSDKSGNTPA